MRLIETRGGVRQDWPAWNPRSLTMVMDSLSGGLVVLSAEGKIELANQAAHRILELAGRRGARLQFNESSSGVFRSDSGARLPAADFPNRRALDAGQAVSGIILGVDRTDGERVWLDCNAVLLSPADPESQVVVSFTDVTEMRAMYERLAVDGERDALTGLPNLKYVIRYINELLGTVRSTDRRKVDVVMVINFDKLRQLNDSLGHLGGDRALASTAERLRDELPEPHLIGRVVGAEFVAVLRDVDEEDVEDVSDFVHVLLTEPSEIDGIPVRLRASVGLARIRPDDVRSAEEIIGAADTAMYHARTKGGGHTVDFDALRIAD
jgi:diguanylate cyclase (GGDEF)-like protein